MDYNNLGISLLTALLIGFSIMAFCIYRREGDIKNLCSDFSYEKLETEYNTPKKILTRLQKILTYKYNYVYWIFYLLIAGITSLLINLLIASLTKTKITFLGVFFGMILIFGAMELPKRFLETHVHKMSEVEGGNLIAMLGRYI